MIPRGKAIVNSSEWDQFWNEMPPLAYIPAEVTTPLNEITKVKIMNIIHL